MGFDHAQIDRCLDQPGLVRTPQRLGDERDADRLHRIARRILAHAEGVGKGFGLTGAIGNELEAFAVASPLNRREMPGCDRGRPVAGRVGAAKQIFMKFADCGR